MLVVGGGFSPRPEVSGWRPRRKSGGLRNAGRSVDEVELTRRFFRGLPGAVIGDGSSRP